MATKTAAKTKSTEEILWDSANKLRGSVEPSGIQACCTESHLPQVCE